MKFDEKDQKLIVTELRRLVCSVTKVDEYIIEFLLPSGERTQWGKRTRASILGSTE